MTIHDFSKKVSDVRNLVGWCDGMWYGSKMKQSAFVGSSESQHANALKNAAKENGLDCCFENIPTSFEGGEKQLLTWAFLTPQLP